MKSESIPMRVLGAMNEGQSYDLETLKASTKLPEKTIKYCIDQLVAGGIVDEVTGNRFYKSREWRSNQKRLFS